MKGIVSNERFGIARTRESTSRRGYSEKSMRESTRERRRVLDSILSFDALSLCRTDLDETVWSCLTTQIVLRSRQDAMPTAANLRDSVIRRKMEIVRQLERIRDKYGAVDVKGNDDSNIKDSSSTKRRRTDDSVEDPTGSVEKTTRVKRRQLRARRYAMLPADYENREIRRLEARYFEILNDLNANIPSIDMSARCGPAEGEAAKRRANSHWTALMGEMQWMANDFFGERRWKRNAALNVSDEVASFHTFTNHTNHQRKRRSASSADMATSVSSLWKRKRRRLDEVRARSKLVDPTEAPNADDNDSEYGDDDESALMKASKHETALLAVLKGMIDDDDEEDDGDDHEGDDNERDDALMYLPEYQNRIVRWLLKIQGLRLNGAICSVPSRKEDDEVLSLGDVRILGTFFELLSKKKARGTHLIVTDETRVLRWRAAMARNCPSLNISVLDRCSDANNFRRALRACDVGIVSEQFVRDCVGHNKHFLFGMNWSVAVMDRPSVLTLRENDDDQDVWDSCDRLLALSRKSKMTVSLHEPFEWDASSKAARARPHQMALRFAFLFPRSFGTDDVSSREVSNRIWKWIDGDGSKIVAAKTKGKKAKSRRGGGSGTTGACVAKRLLQMLEVRCDHVALRPLLTKNVLLHVNVSCPLGVRQTNLCSSLLATSKHENALSLLTRLHYLTNHPFALPSRVSNVRSSFVQSTRIEMTLSRCVFVNHCFDRSRSIRAINLKFLGAVFTQHELSQNQGVISRNINVASSSRVFAVPKMTAQKRDKSSIVPFAVQTKMRPKKPQPMIEPLPSYIDNSGRWKGTHNNYVNWWRCSSTRVMYGRHTINAFRVPSWTAAVHVRAAQMPRALSIVSTYRTSWSFMSNAELAVIPAIAGPPYLRASGVSVISLRRRFVIRPSDAHLVRSFPFDNTNALPKHRVISRGSARFDKIIHIIRWHLDRGGKVVMGFRSTHVMSTMCRRLSSGCIRYVTSSTSASTREHLDRLQAFNADTSIGVLVSLMNCNLASEVREASPMNVTAIIFVDADAMDYTTSPLYRSFAFGPSRPIVLYRLTWMTEKKKRASKKKSKSSTVAVEMRNGRFMPWGDATLSAACCCVEGAEKVSSEDVTDRSESTIHSSSEAKKMLVTLSSSGSRKKKRSNAASNSSVSMDTLKKYLVLASRLSSSLMLSIESARRDDVKDDMDVVSDVRATGRPSAVYDTSKAYSPISMRSALNRYRESSSSPPSLFLSRSESAKRTTYEVAKLVHRADMFDGEPVDNIVDESEGLEMDESDWTRQMRIGMQRRIFSSIQTTRARTVGRQSFGSHAVRKWAKEHRDNANERDIHDTAFFDSAIYGPPNPNHVEVELPAPTKDTSRPALMAVYRFDPKKHHIDTNVFDSLRRAVRIGDQGILEKAVDETGRRKAQSFVRKKRSVSSKAKDMDQSRTSYFAIRQRHVPWYQSRPIPEPSVSWTKDEDETIVKSLGEFGFNWNLVSKRVQRVGTHPRVQRSKRDCFLRFMALREMARRNNDQRFFMTIRNRLISPDLMGTGLDDHDVVPHDAKIAVKARTTHKKRRLMSKGEEWVSNPVTLSSAFVKRHKKSSSTFVFDGILSSAGLQHNPIDPIFERYTHGSIEVSNPHASHTSAVKKAGPFAVHASPSPAQIIDIRNKRKKAIQSKSRSSGERSRYQSQKSTSSSLSKSKQARAPPAVSTAASKKPALKTSEKSDRVANGKASSSVYNRSPLNAKISKMKKLISDGRVSTSSTTILPKSLSDKFKPRPLSASSSSSSKKKNGAP